MAKQTKPQPTSAGEAPDGYMYGNKDKNKEHLFKESEKGYYVARHVRLAKLPSGGVVEDEGTIRYAKYRPEFIEEQRFLLEKNETTIFNTDEEIKFLHEPK